MAVHTKIKDKMTDKEERDLKVFLDIVESVENDPKVREEMEENQRRYGILTGEDLMKRFTI